MTPAPLEPGAEPRRIVMSLNMIMFANDEQDAKETAREWVAGKWGQELLDIVEFEVDPI